MKHHDFRFERSRHAEAGATCLTLPGLGCSGPGHWQALWEARRADCARVDLGCWDDPHRDVWRDRLDGAVRAVTGPVVLAAHSLGCFAVAWWAQTADTRVLERVCGALLVAPPDVDRPGVDVRLKRFAPTPIVALPFRAILVASENDPYASIARSREMAAVWGAELFNLGATGHINALSGLGPWDTGQTLLDELLGHHTGD